MTTIASVAGSTSARSRQASLVLLDGVLLTLVGAMLLIGVVLPRTALIEAFIQAFGFLLVIVGAAGIVGAFRMHEAGFRSLLLFVGPFLALLLGFGAIFSPGVTAVSAMQVFGALAIAGGVLEIIAAISLPGREHWGLLLLNGILTLAAGVVMIASPGIALFVLFIFFGVQLVFLGAHRIRVALRLRRLLH